MFKNCTALSSAPILNSIEINDGCYNSMFWGCTSLKNAPTLPAITLSSSCYQNMFYGCTALSSAPSLPATDLISSCYNSMFYGCTALSSAPVLNATNLDVSCYNAMFKGCTALSSTPSLPATTLADNCYSEMFRDCSNLEIGPSELPAQTLVTRSYYAMFTNCSKLKTPMNISAETLAPQAMQSMLYGCSLLSSVSVKFTEWDNTNNSTFNWLVNTSANGEFYSPYTLTIVRNSTSPNIKYGIPADWIINKIPLTFIAIEGNSTIQLSGTSTMDLSGVKYNKNDTGWYSLPADSISLNEGDTIQFENSNSSFGTSDSNYAKFVMGGSGKIKAEGSVQSLLNYSKTCPNFAFCNLFNGCTNLTDAPELPAESIGKQSYYQMFKGCSSLIKAPEIRVNTITGTNSSGMSSFGGMFMNCTLLENPPSILRPTSLTNNCCVSMFNGCSKLNSSPLLMATNFGTGTYGQMFKGCSSLNTITVKFTEWGTFTTNWLNGVNSTGDFYGPNELIESISDGSIERSISTVPTDWVLHNI